MAIRVLPLPQWHAKDKRARAPALAGGAATPAQGNIKPVGHRRALQRNVTPPVWSRPGPPSADNDLVASPALLPSPSGGELAFALDAEDDGDDGANQAGCGALGSAPANGAAASGGSEGGAAADDSMVAFLASKMGELTTAALEPPDETPAPEAEPWLAASSPQAAAAAIAALLAGGWQGWRAAAEVVAIVSPSARRRSIVGVLLPGSNDKELLLAPCNPRMPQLRVPVSSLPAPHRGALLAGARAPDGASRTLVSGGIVCWGEGDVLPEGEVEDVVGEAGGLEVETRALLMMERVEDDDQFTPDVSLNMFLLLQ